LAGLASNVNLTGQDLGGLTLTPDVYTYNSSAELTGQLTLNFEGLSNQVIVFPLPSASHARLPTALAELQTGWEIWL
jgi:type VI secretion system secreted protein VgrG